MVGAIVGIENIQRNWMEKIMAFDCTKLKEDKSKNKVGRQRPEFLSVKKHMVENIKQLILLIPDEHLSADYIIIDSSGYKKPAPKKV